MKFRHLGICVVLTAMAACSAGTGVQLQVHEGPIATSNPGLVIKALSRGQGNNGTISYALPDGATCSGGWEVTTNRAGRGLSNSQLAALGPGSGQVTKDGYVSSPEEGGRVFHGNRGSEGLGGGNCSNGATFIFAFVANGIQGRGALKDSNGNIFRIVLQ